MRAGYPTDWIPPSRNRRSPMPIIAIALAAAAAIWYCLPYIQGEAEYSDIRKTSAPPIEASEPISDQNAGDPLMQREIDWDGLRAINADVIGWIYVPNTPIDYPVVQAPVDDPGKYLRTTFEGAVSWPNNQGTIYLDSSCSEDGWSSESPLLYGHYQLNNSMFSAFSKNYEQSTLASHDSIYIYTPSGSIHLRAFAANAVNADVEKIRLDFSDADDLNNWLDSKIAESEAVSYDPGHVDQLWTFCVCSYHIWQNQRTLTYAEVIDSTTTYPLGFNKKQSTKDPFRDPAAESSLERED